MTKGKGSHNNKNSRMGQDNTNTNEGADDDNGNQGVKTNNEEGSIDEGPENQDDGNRMTGTTQHSPLPL